MNLYKKIANANHENIANDSTRTVSKHGLGRRARLKRIANRRAKRIEARAILADQDT